MGELGHSAVRRYIDGVEGQVGWVVLDDLIYTSGYQVGTGCQLGQLMQLGVVSLATEQVSLVLLMYR